MLLHLSRLRKYLTHLAVGSHLTTERGLEWEADSGADKRSHLPAGILHLDTLNFSVLRVLNIDTVLSNHVCSHHSAAHSCNGAFVLGLTSVHTY